MQYLFPLSILVLLIVCDSQLGLLFGGYLIRTSIEHQNEDSTGL